MQEHNAAMYEVRNHEEAANNLPSNGPDALDPVHPIVVTLAFRIRQEQLQVVEGLQVHDGETDAEAETRDEDDVVYRQYGDPEATETEGLWEESNGRLFMLW